MAKVDKRDVRARRAAMERTKVRSVTGAENEKSRRKQQLRLEKQEQRLADRLERQTAKADASDKPVKKISLQSKDSAKNKKQQNAHWDEKIKAFVSAQKRTKNTAEKKDKEFQIVLGTKSKKILRLFSVISVVLVAIILINSLVPISIWEYTQNIFAGSGSGDGFPVSISPSDTNHIVPVGSDVALLGDSSLTLYKSNGKVLFQRQHGYSEPAVCSCSARVMVYDRGGKNLRVENRAKTLFTLETDGAITAAAMASNGYFAVVTRGVNYISDVTAYNADGQQTFVWHSASRQVLGVALSDNGRYMAVSTLQMENGQGVTVVLVFDTRKGVTLAEESYAGSTPISIDMKGNVTVAVLNDRITAITKSGERSDRLFEGGTVTCFDNYNDFGTVLVLGMYQDSRNNRLLVLDEDLESFGEAEIGQEVFAVSAKGNRVSLLSEQKVLFYSRGGSSKGESVLESDGKTLVCKGNYAIVMGTDTLHAVYR
ncbi:MAG: cell envelope integrity protein TolA [Clostridia bacterium]|nr:cell envelope integrity protein TolA [Clostridia bacterium]